MIYTEFQEEQDLKDIIEETFDLCTTNKEEIYWLITLLRNFMQIPNKRTEFNKENYKLNLWQYNLYPIIEKYRKKWKHSNG